MTDALDTFSTISELDLAAVNGGFDVNRMVDAGNRWAGAGAAVGGGIGLAVGAPGGPPGMATGAGIGMAAGGAIGWAAGAGRDAYNQVRGR
ncbi:MAG TPA: hypothetical protein VFQ53_16415 [Kofleriaceae bacterium]|nr:hypothetical protein [Kofleriaceae bacterium]